VNKCYRGGPCLFGEQVKVGKEAEWDYYDKASRSFIYLKCKLNQKYYTPNLLQIEEEDKYQSGLSTESYETPDLHLADQNGVWMTRSEDPECYEWPPEDEPKTCPKCDLVCDIRDDKRYLNDDGSCPFSDATPYLRYWKIEDYDRPCQDFLHPLLLQDIDAINRRRRRAAKAKLWSYLKEPKWMHALINSGQRIIDVWRRHYQPVTFYYHSFDTIKLYIKNLPPEARKNRHLLKRIRQNIEKSPSFRQLLESWEEESKLEELDKYIGRVVKGKKL
jgi:hypothetical protein